MNWVILSDDNKFVNLDLVMHAREGCAMTSDHYVAMENGKPVKELTLFFVDGTKMAFQDEEMRVIRSALWAAQKFRG